MNTRTGNGRLYGLYFTLINFYYYCQHRYQALRSPTEIITHCEQCGNLLHGAPKMPTAYACDACGDVCCIFCMFDQQVCTPCVLGNKNNV